MIKSSELCHRTFYNIVHARQMFSYCIIVMIFIIECTLLKPVVSGINHNEFLAQLKVPQCRKDCLDKVCLTRIFHCFSLFCSDGMVVQQTEERKNN